jgi:hypothetical protein
VSARPSAQSPHTAGATRRPRHRLESSASRFGKPAYRANLTSSGRFWPACGRCAVPHPTGTPPIMQPARGVSRRGSAPGTAGRSQARW